MTKNKIVVVVMGQDCEKTIGMALESVKDADAIVYCDGGSMDNIINVLDDSSVGIDFIENEFDQSNPLAIPEQKNFWLEYLKKNYNGWWALYLDADEVVDDFSKFRDLLKKDWEEEIVFSPRMKHFIYNIGLEDATRPHHNVPNRFFKVTDSKFFPPTEHTILSSHKEGKIYNFDLGLIWHLGYVGGVWDVKKRYDGQLLRKEANHHPLDFLHKWRDAHLFGKYPVKPVDPLTIPKIILDNFGIDKDELYFRDRGLELKHFTDAIHWKEFFNCKTAIEFGCGKGPRVYAMNNIGVDTMGIEISKFANSVKMHKNITEGNVIRGKLESTSIGQSKDLCIAYDLLEHISYEDLNIAIDTLIASTNSYILVSVPFVGTQNCEADATHIIKEDRDWWIAQFRNKGLIVIPTPEHFLYREQVMIFQK